MTARPDEGPEPAEAAPPVDRLFVREPGWQIRQKVGSVREFCYMIAPGQDHYHRLLDGEIHLQRGDEKLCLPCADRRGLLTHEPKRLGRPAIAQEIEPGEAAGFDLSPPP